MLKCPDIKFDKIILCGSIVNENFDWDTLIKRNQVFYIRNEYSKTEKVTKYAKLLAHLRTFNSAKSGFNESSNCYDQINCMIVT